MSPAAAITGSLTSSPVRGELGEAVKAAIGGRLRAVTVTMTSRVAEAPSSSATRTSTR